MSDFVPLPGIYSSLPDTDYHAQRDWLSASMLKLLADAPSKLRAYLDGDGVKLDAEGNPEEEAGHFKLGRYAHGAILEDRTAEDMGFLVRPEGLDGRTKDGKAWLAAHDGQTVISRQQVVYAERMRAALRRDKDAASTLFGAGRNELSAFAESAETGLQLRCRADRLPDNNPFVVDVKTCRSARKDDFWRAALKLGYHIQAAHYLETLKLVGEHRTGFVFVAIESKPPFDFVVYVLDDDVLEFGRRKLAELYDAYKRCRDTGNWPSYATGFTPLSYPPFAMR